MENTTNALLDFLNVVNTSNDISTLLTKAVRTAEIITSSEFGEIVLTNNAWKFLEYKFATLQEIKLLETLRDQLNKKIIATFTSTKASLQISDEDEYNLCNSSIPTSNEYKNKHIKNFITSAIRISSTNQSKITIGALKLFNKSILEDFSEKDFSFIKVFTEQLSKAIEREIMQVRLQNFENRIVGIFNALTEPILVCNKNGTPIMANKAFYDIFYPNGTDNQMLSSILPSLLASNENEDKGYHELVLLKPHAQIYYSNFVKTKDIDGNILDIIFSFRDITNNKKSDQEFFHLITYISRKIKFLSKLLFKQIKLKNKAKLFKYKLISLILDFSKLIKLKAGPLRIQKFPITFSDFLNEINEKLCSFANKYNIKLTFENNIPDECQFEMVLLDVQNIVKSFYSLLKFCINRSNKNLNAVLKIRQEQNHYVLELQIPIANLKEIPQNYLLDWQKVIKKFIENPNYKPTFALAYVHNLIEAHKGCFSINHIKDKDLLSYKILLPKEEL